MANNFAVHITAPPFKGSALKNGRNSRRPERIVLNNFSSLGLSERLVAQLDAIGLDTPTPIQSQAIPALLEGRDVMGLAQTGTGKTAAFGLPLLHHLQKDNQRPAQRGVRALILAPTRELANQITESLLGFSQGHQMRLRTVVGGVSINGQIRRLEKGADILVATPGRLLDLLARRAVRLSDTRYLVLDEADQMLDMGFIKPLREIAKHLPTERQTLLFSATMPKAMAELAKTFLNNPKRIEVTPVGRPADKITQSVHFVEKRDKLALLKDLLSAHPQELTVIFVRTKHGAERMCKQLSAAGFATEAIHGNRNQNQRDRALKAFRAGKVHVLVATDVAARGIDIPAVRHVYNVDLPNVSESYIHRIGRTARAGAEGRAIAFCAPDEIADLAAIEKLLGQNIDVATGTRWDIQSSTKKPARRRNKPHSGHKSQSSKPRAARTTSDAKRGGFKGDGPQPKHSRNRRRPSAA